MRNIYLLLLIMTTLYSQSSQTTTVYYYDEPEPVKAYNTSRDNINFSLWPPSVKSFEAFLHNSVIRDEAVSFALDNPMLSPKTALLSAMYHDYVENNASSGVFELYEYAASNEGFVGKRRGYLAFADFLIRTKNYPYILENLDPNLCYQNKPVCAYYRVAAGLLYSGSCDAEWYNTALKYSRKSKFIKSKCYKKVK